MRSYGLAGVSNNLTVDDVIARPDTPIVRKVHQLRQREM